MQKLHYDCKNSRRTTNIGPKYIVNLVTYVIYFLVIDDKINAVHGTQFCWISIIYKYYL